MLKNCKERNATRQSSWERAAAGVFLQGKRQLHKSSRTTTTNLDRETQKIQKRLAKPLLARLKSKWSEKKPSSRSRSSAKIRASIFEPASRLDRCRGATIHDFFVDLYLSLFMTVPPIDRSDIADRIDPRN